MITQIKIINFKAITSESLTIAPLTILTGTNSSGKSSVLQAIMLLAKHSKIENKYSMDSVIRYLNDFSIIRNKKTNAKEIEIAISLKNHNELCVLKLSAENNHSNTFFDYVYESSDSDNEKELFYLNANRLGAQDIVAISEQKIGTFGEFIFSTFDKVKLKLIHEDLITSNESKTLAYQLSYWLTKISDIPIELITEKIGDQIKVSYMLKNHEGNVSPFNLGAGISHLAKVLIICLIAKKGDLILLENPEVQLHPKSQAKLGEFLSFIASKGIQLIIETHCEHLISRIRYEVGNDKIDCDDVIIHYKESSNDNFKSLYLDSYGHFVDDKEKILSFPKGFFDISVDYLLNLK